MDKTKSKLFISTSEQPWEELGDRIRRKILGYDEQLMMVYIQFKKGSVGKLHQHPHRQVTFVEKGSFEVEIGGIKKILQSGNCFFVPPNEIHGVRALEDGELIDVFTPIRDDFLK